MHPPDSNVLDDPAAIDLTDEAEMCLVRDRLLGLINGRGIGVAFDPIIHIQSGAEVGREALARFPESSSTAEWFRVAHALGVGDDLELEVVTQVVERLDDQRGFVGINLSPQTIMDPRCGALIAPCERDRVVIEITDQTAMPKWSMMRAPLAVMRDRGVRVACHVPDFGPENLQNLLMVQPDLVKIGPTATATLAAGQTDAAQTANFFARCRYSGVFVVAVGVETEEQLEALQGIGVDAYQGFLTHR